MTPVDTLRDWLNARDSGLQDDEDLDALLSELDDALEDAEDARLRLAQLAAARAPRTNALRERVRACVTNSGGVLRFAAHSGARPVFLYLNPPNHGGAAGATEDLVDAVAGLLQEALDGII